MEATIRVIAKRNPKGKNEIHRITLNKVGYAPSGKRNLISGSRAMQADCTWSGRSNEILVRNKQNRLTLRFVERERELEGTWERIAKQRPMTGKFPGRFDSTLSYEGKTFRSAKAVREFCTDNDIEYADASVRQAFKNNNPFQGVWDIKDVAVGRREDSSPDMSPDEGTSTSNVVDLSVYFNDLECSNMDLSNPLTYKETIEAPDRLDWESAMNDEVETLRERNVFKEVVRTPDLKVLDHKWVFVQKRDAGGKVVRHRARLVARGFLQDYGKEFTEVYNPVAMDVLDASEYPYRTLVGILMFISRYNRPDICVAINILARYNSAPNTKEKCIHLSKSLDLDVNCYVDASWATSVKDRKSITGYLICVGRNPIIWRCTKQSLVTMSAMEAELIALSQLVKEMIWFKRCLVDSFVVHCDNRAGMHFVKNDVENFKTKYIDVKIQFVKENYESKLFSLQYINTKENLADVLTKRVNYQKIIDLCKYLDVYDQKC
uniref:Reverse transcriptase Ty1/copia-type domain-containing protein n=1 Tax=Strigamia maritima TaxID=126957 RepID=T1JF44_STRMM